jgi:hypothetical protein
MKRFLKNSIMFTCAHSCSHSHAHTVAMLECMQELVHMKTSLTIQLSKFFFVSIDEITMWIAKGGLLFMCMWLKVGNTYLFC